MRITRLTLKNWGPHENLDLDMDAPVFGLLGPNASGKSNIMSAIAFAFTGLLERNQASYVRDAAGEEIGNGSVDLHFIKGGIKGRIFRQVGKSPSRKLWWEDWSKPLTKAGEVEKLLAQILDCDRQAINQAVFLSQGHLADFLAGTPAQREEDFARMCLVDHLGAVAEVAGQAAANLQKTITDLTSQKDEANHGLEQSLNALRLAESELELHTDMTKQVNWVERRITSHENRDRAQGTCQVALQAVHSAEEHLKGIAVPAGFVAGDLEESETHLNNQIAEATAAKANLGSMEVNWSRLQSDRQALQLQKIKLGEILAKTPILGEIHGKLGQLQSSMHQLQSYTLWKQRQDSWQVGYNNCTESIEKGLQEIAKLQSPESLKQERKKLEGEKPAVDATRFRLNLLKQTAGHVDGCCPLCRGTDLSQLPAAEDIQRLESECAAQAEAHAQTLARLDEETSKHTRYQERLRSLQLQKTELEKQQPEPWQQEVPPASPTLDELRAKEQELTLERNKLQAELGGLPHVNSTIQQLEKSISDSALKDLTEAEFFEERRRLSELASHLPGLQEALRRLNDYRTRRQSAVAHLEASQRQLILAEENLGKAVAAYEACFHEKPRDLSVTADQGLNELKETLLALKARQDARARAQGAVTANAEALRRAEHRVEEIRQRAERNAATMSVIGHLEELRMAFSRHGIPRHYLSKVFDALVTITQENLSQWETDFQVEKDEANLFNFLFFRTDAPETLLDQSQLSGGQKTRLALSFVQAVQQLLYPGLDFLCVDEPSNHLDSDGVEGLVRLFQTISAQNAKGEAQVIVVDHNKELERAFVKSHTLTRLRS